MEYFFSKSIAKMSVTVPGTNIVPFWRILKQIYLYLLTQNHHFFKYCINIANNIIHG